MASKATILKIIALVVAIVLFLYSIIFQSESKRLILRISGAIDLQCYVVFGGYLVIYIAYGIALLVKEELDKELNTIWAFLGFAFHVGLGFLLIDLGRQSNKFRDDDGNSQWMISGIISLCQAAVLFMDAWVAAGGDLCGK